ncbi:MAG: hypothetical protein GC178_02730 [Flavobacteriales bacterium]|nr:hypothetical protein [Flavobacteriales bacterium]
MDQKEQYQSIVRSLKEKSTYKHEVLNKTKEYFETFKSEAEKLADELCKEVDCLEGIDVKFTHKGSFQGEIQFGEDLLIFFLHNDVFDFDKSHRVWKTSYVEADRMRAYCGMISIFNFLNTSFEMNRLEDMGYLVGRLFINKEGHYFVEGKKQLGFLYNDFGSETISPTAFRSIIMSAILYCQEFDLLTPPYNAMSELQVGQMIDITNKMSVKTGKRLGFRFSSETDSDE